MQAVMIRFGEIFLKSEPVRREFMNALKNNIAAGLSAHNISADIEELRGRLLIHGEDSCKIIAILKRIFGIIDVSPATLTTNNLPDLCLTAADYATKHLTPGSTFAIRAKRDGVEGFTSQILGAEAGGAVIDRFPEAQVDLTTPDYEIFIEARKTGGIVYDERIPGPGGLPYGTQGSLVSLISAGIDSPVASWFMMKRGIIPVFVNIEGHTFFGDDVEKNVLRNICALSLWAPGHTLTLYVINGEPLYSRIMNIREMRLRCVACKRSMLLIASALAIEKGAGGIITGDNLGQVATQTLSNLNVLTKGIESPIYRPLIAFDKEEIIMRAKQIGTFSHSPGDTSCRVVPKKPATKTDQKKVSGLEEEIDIRGLIPCLLGNMKKIKIRDGKII